jgi:hypothetical protein
MLKTLSHVKVEQKINIKEAVEYQIAGVNISCKAVRFHSLIYVMIRKIISLKSGAQNRQKHLACRKI